MNETLIMFGIEYLTFVDLCYVFKLRNYWEETRPGYVPSERSIENPCGFAHSFVPKLWPILLPTPFEYGYIIGQYMKDYKEAFPDSSFAERATAWILNDCTTDKCNLKSREIFKGK